MEVVVTLPEFKFWHVKHQANYHWLTHACVATLKPVLALLGKIRSNFGHHEFLKAGDSLPCNKHTKLMCLMNGTIERLKIGMVINSMNHCDKALQSCNFF